MWFFADDSVVLDLNQAVPSLCYWKNSSSENKNVVSCWPCRFSHIWCTFVKHKKFSRMYKLLFSKQRFIYGPFFVICRVYCSVSLPRSMLTCFCRLDSVYSYSLSLESTLEIMQTFFCVLQKKKSYGFGKTRQHENIHFWMNYSFKTYFLITVRLFSPELRSVKILIPTWEEEKKR